MKHIRQLPAFLLMLAALSLLRCDASTEASAEPRYTTLIQKLLAPDGQADDYFGISVALSGDYAIVGARGEDSQGRDAGAAYIFQLTGSNSWDGGTKLLAPDAQAGDAFGNSVALSGVYAIVGAYGEDSQGSHAGAAYVFQRTGANSWDGGTKLLAPDGQADDYFGNSVALSGDYAIVGAYHPEPGLPSDEFRQMLKEGLHAPYTWRVRHIEDSPGGVAGAAYVFQRTGGNSWDGGTKLVAPDGQADDWFGSTVAISGDYALVGAHKEDSQGSNAGAAYVFQRTGGNSWVGGTKLVAPNGQLNDYFGVSVAVSGDYAIVGANGEDSQGGDAGAAYVFLRTGADSWDSGTQLLALDAQAFDGFGFPVPLGGDYAIVGAIGEDSQGSNAGAAYVFQRTGANSWDGGTKLLAPDAQAGDMFGVSVAFSGDYAIVGARGEDSQGSDAGAAYIFE